MIQNPSICKLDKQHVVPSKLTEEEKKIAMELIRCFTKHFEKQEIFLECAVLKKMKDILNAWPLRSN